MSNVQIDQNAQWRSNGVKDAMEEIVSDRLVVILSIRLKKTAESECCSRQLNRRCDTDSFRLMATIIQQNRKVVIT